MSSILNDVKKTLGVHESNTDFDVDILMHTNTALFQLNQLGVGPTTGIIIDDPEAQWEYVVGARMDLEAIKSYVYISVRLIFDPPGTSYAIQAMERLREELAWRIEIQRKEVQHAFIDG